MTQYKFLTVGIALSLCAGCSSDKKERVAAIAEVEAHCGLPENTLDRNFSEKRFAKTKEMSEEEKKNIDKIIDLGSFITDDRIGKKRDCIMSFTSKWGYRFNISMSSSN
jgi:hypothetical protein